MTTENTPNDTQKHPPAPKNTIVKNLKNLRTGRVQGRGGAPRRGRGNRLARRRRARRPMFSSSPPEGLLHLQIVHNDALKPAGFYFFEHFGEWMAGRDGTINIFT